jgi:hypothetical protein
MGANTLEGTGSCEAFSPKPGEVSSGGTGVRDGALVTTLAGTVDAETLSLLENCNTGTEIEPAKSDVVPVGSLTDVFNSKVEVCEKLASGMSLHKTENPRPKYLV